MAELTKPQYHKRKTYPTQRESYRLDPARTDFARPSDVPNQMHTASNVFSSLSKSLDVFQGLYQQSANTANQLQARDLIGKKAKHTQNLKELLKLHLPNTKYQDLKLGDVIEKIRTIDGEGRSDLNIGAENEHNVSLMQLPDDLSPEVKALIEETFIREDVGFMTSLMSQVENVQTTQSALILSRFEKEYKAGVFQDFHTAKNRYDGLQAANKRRLTLNAEIDALAKTASWSQLEIEDKKRSAGQLMLQQDFNSAYNRKGTLDRTEEQTRMDVLNMAKKGEFKYLDANNKEVVLDPDYYSTRYFTELEQNRTERINSRERDEIDNQKLELGRRIRKLVEKGEINLDSITDNTFSKLTEKGQFSKLSHSEIFGLLHNEEIRLKNITATEKEKEENNILQETLSTLREDLSTDDDFKLNIRKYADKVYEEKVLVGRDQGEYKTKKWTGKYKPKSPEYLKQHFGNKFEQRFVRDIITAYFQGKAKNKEMFAIAQSDAKVKEFIATQKQRIQAGASSIAKLLEDFSSSKVGTGGHIEYYVDEKKIAPGTPGGVLLRNAGIDFNARFPDKPEQAIIATKKHILQNLINEASNESRKIHDALLKQQEGEIVTPLELTKRLDNIAGSYHTSLESMKQQDDDAYVDRVGPWKNKKPNLAQLNTELAFKATLDLITDFAQLKKTYTLKELETYKNELRNEKINGKPIDKSYSSSLSSYIQRVAQELEDRQRELITDTRNVGFRETEQEAHLGTNGKYDMNKYWVWLNKKGLSTTNIEIISSNEADMMQNIDKATQEQTLEYFGQLFPILKSYGNPGSWGYDTALANIMKNLDEKYQMTFLNMIGANGSFRPVTIKRIWNFGRTDLTGGP